VKPLPRGENILHGTGLVVCALAWFCSACLCASFGALLLFVLVPMGLSVFYYYKIISLRFLWFVSLLFSVRAMQMKFCLHECKNLCFVLVVLSVQVLFLLLGLRSLLVLSLIEHIYLSKTCVAFFSCGLTPNCYFLAVGNLSYFAQFVLML